MAHWQNTSNKGITEDLRWILGTRFRYSLLEPTTNTSLCDVLARGKGLLTKQAYLSTISMLKFAEFPCFGSQQLIRLLWTTLWYIVNRCLIEPGWRHLELGASAINKPTHIKGNATCHCLILHNMHIVAWTASITWACTHDLFLYLLYAVYYYSSTILLQCGCCDTSMSQVPP